MCKYRLQWKMKNGKGNRKIATSATCLHNANWNRSKVMALINYKKRKHIVLKQIIDPKANMVLTKDGWSKIAKDLQKTTKSKSPPNGKCARTSGLVSTTITRGFLIVTRALVIIHPTWTFDHKRKRNFIFQKTSLNHTAMLLQLSKGRGTSIFLCV
jgi:hypothetical protein